MLHVTFSVSGAATLRQALSARGDRSKVAALSDNLSWGPIFSTHSNGRQAWLNASLPGTCNPSDTPYWDTIASGAQQFETQLDAADQHLVWVAPQNAEELCALHWYLDIYGGEKATFVLVDRWLGGMMDGERLLSLGQLGVHHFEHLIETADRLPWDRLRFPRDRWSKLRDDSTNLRIVNLGIATSVAESFFDDALLANCAHRWRRLARVMADTMIAQGDAQHYVTPDILLWRFRELGSRKRIIADREVVWDGIASDYPIMVRLAD